MTERLPSLNCTYVYSYCIPKREASLLIEILPSPYNLYTQDAWLVGGGHWAVCGGQCVVGGGSGGWWVVDGTANPPPTTHPSYRELAFSLCVVYGCCIPEIGLPG